MYKTTFSICHPLSKKVRFGLLQVNCKYYHDGCHVLDTKSAIMDHEKRCGCREVTCPNSECDTRLQVRQIFSHIKDKHKDALTRDDKVGVRKTIHFIIICVIWVIYLQGCRKLQKLLEHLDFITI